MAFDQDKQLEMNLPFHETSVFPSRDVENTPLLHTLVSTEQGVVALERARLCKIKLNMKCMESIFKLQKNASTLSRLILQFIFSLLES